MNPTLGHGKICYVGIPSTDVERSAAFYAAVFGWEIRKRSNGTTAFNDSVGQVSGAFVPGRPPQGEAGLLLYVMVDDAAAAVEDDRRARRRDRAAHRRRRARDHRALPRPERQRPRHLPGADARAEGLKDGSGMPAWELAQLNIAVMKEPLESPGMADFVANLDRINALAEASPGFVWRLQSDEGNNTAFRPLGETTLVNMSVWKDVESLNGYVYKTAHVEIMRRRDEWFERMREAFLVLWWVPAGHRPGIDEAVASSSSCASRDRPRAPSASARPFRRPTPGMHARRSRSETSARRRDFALPSGQPERLRRGTRPSGPGCWGSTGSSSRSRSRP